MSAEDNEIQELQELLPVDEEAITPSLVMDDEDEIVISAAGGTINPFFTPTVSKKTKPDKVVDKSENWEFAQIANPLLEAMIGGNEGSQGKRGIPLNRLIVVSGPSQSFKTSHVANIIVQLMVDNPKLVCGILDAEKGWSIDSLRKMGYPESIVKRFSFIKKMSIVKKSKAGDVLYLEEVQPLITAWIQGIDQNTPKILVIDPIMGFPTLAETRIQVEALASGDTDKTSNMKATFERSKKHTALANWLPSMAGTFNCSVFITSHTKEKITIGGPARPSYMPPTIVEDMHIMYYNKASLIIRQSTSYDEDSGVRTNDDIFEEKCGITYAKRYKLMVAIKKTRSEASSTIPFMWELGFGMDGVSAIAHYLNSIIEDSIDQKIEELLAGTVLRVTKEAKNSIKGLGKDRLLEILLKYSTKGPAEYDLLVKLLRPVIYEIYDMVMAKSKRFNFRRFDHLEAEDNKEDK